MAYTITFDANGGTCATSTMSSADIGNGLPPATRSDRLFIGWYKTEEYGWSLVTPQTTFSADTTVTARWIERARSGEELSYYYPVANVSGVTTGLKYQFNSDGTAYAYGFCNDSEADDNSDAVGDVVIPWSVLNTDDPGDSTEYTVVAISVEAHSSLKISNNNNLTSLAAPITVTLLGCFSFYKCTALSSLYANGVESVDRYAICKTGVTALSLPNLKATVGLSALVDNGSLVSLYLPNLMTCLNYSINRYLILESAVIPRLKGGGVGLFQICPSLRSVSLPSLESVATYSFMGYVSYSSNPRELRSVSLPNAKAVYSSCFQAATSLETISLPLATSIYSSGNDDYTFSDCSALKLVSLPSVTTMGTALFHGCPDDQIRIFLWQSSVSVTSFGAQPAAICLRKDMTLNSISYDPESQPQTISLGGKTINIEWYDNTDEDLKFNISFDLQGASGAIGDKVASYGYAMPSVSDLPSKDGYVFGGFYTDPEGLGLKYYNSDGTSAREWDWLEDKTLYAKWTGLQYSVTFDPNSDGVAADPASKTVTNGEPYGELSDTSPSPRTGYSFAGWWTDACGGTRILPDTIVDVTENQTLYALWDATPYTVNLEKQGGVGGDSVATANYGVQMPTVSVPAKAGYSFGGYWYFPDEENIGQNGVRYYTNMGTSARDWDIDAEGATNLYALWTANTYIVTLDKQGGSGGTGSVVTTYGQSMPSATMPMRTGYSFGGYYTEPDGGGTQYYTDQGASAGNWAVASNVTLYAKWTADTFTVTLDKQSGDGGTDSVQAAYGNPLPDVMTPVEPPAEPVTMPTRAGYSFGGYFTETAGAGDQYYTSVGTSARNWDIASATTLYAYWMLNTYTVTISPGYQGEGAATTTVEYSYSGSSQTVSIALPTRDGYEIDGWTFMPVGGGAFPSQQMPSVSDDDLTIPAGTATGFIATPIWVSEVEYTVSFDDNAPSGVTATGSMSSQTIRYASYTRLTENQFGAEGYVFKGWNTEADGSGAFFSDRADGSWMNVASGDDVTLYAMWQSVPQPDDAAPKTKTRRLTTEPTFDVQLSPLPNQIISRMFRGIMYDLHFRTFNGMMYVDISVSGEMVASGVRCISNSWLIPNYAASIPGSGNFMFTTLGDAYPWYADFGDTCKLGFYDEDDYKTALEEA